LIANCTRLRLDFQGVIDRLRCRDGPLFGCGLPSGCSDYTRKICTSAVFWDGIVPDHRITSSVQKLFGAQVGATEQLRRLIPADPGDRLDQGEELYVLSNQQMPSLRDF
jgi:hypothetical protein